MIDLAMHEFIANRTLDVCVADACALLCDGFFATSGSSSTPPSSVLASLDIANAWLRAPLPARRYAGAERFNVYNDELPTGEWVLAEMARCRPAPPQATTTTTTAKAFESSGPRRTQLLDMANAVVVEQTGVREEQQTNSERQLTVRVDTETETASTVVREAQRQATKELRELMQRAFGSSAVATDGVSFIATVARTWLTITLEPVALRIELVLNSPDTRARRLDIERAIEALRVRAASAPVQQQQQQTTNNDGNDDDDENRQETLPLPPPPPTTAPDPLQEQTARYVQNNIARLVVHLFTGCPELGVPIVALTPDGQRGAFFLASAASLLFDTQRCAVRACRETLDGFLYNAVLDEALDRTRLIVGACRAVLVDQEPERFEHCRAILRATLDDALLSLLRLPRVTPKQIAVLQRAIEQLVALQE